MPRSTSARNSCQRAAEVRLLAPVAARGSRGSAAASRGSRRRGRLSTFSSIPCDTWNRETSGSGGAPISRLNVFRSQLTKLCSGGFRLTTFLPSLAAFSLEPEVLDDVLRRLRDDEAAVVEALAPGAPGDLVEVARARGCAVFWPSNLQSRVNSTVRIGTLMPTPSVSVPQMTLSRPACASCSTSTRYFGSSPAWCRPMPCLSHLRMSAP